MEAVAALGVACNMIQLIQAGQEAASICRQVYKDGKDVQTSLLQTTTQSLRDTIAEAQNLPAVTQMKTLSTTSQNCLKTATQLQKELDDISLRGKKSALRVLGITLRSMAKASHIQKLKGQLNSYENLMNTQILVHLTFVAAELKELAIRKQLAAIEDNQVQMQIDLNPRLQSLATALRNGNKLLADLVTDHATAITKSIQDEHERMNNTLSANFQDMKLSRAKDAKRQQILDELHFPEISQRQEEVKTAHKNTFKWVLEPDSEKLGKWDSFVEWLETGSNTYWFQGKPGSGKSTLMNFIVNDERETVRTHLEIWAQSPSIYILSAFFWEAGTALQKNVVGLLRTLLWQLMKQDQSTGGNLRARVEQLTAGQDGTVWTEKRLLQLLKSILQTQDLWCCIFLDGLDEFDSEDLLLDLIGHLERMENVKMCVSSRPNIAFVKAFTKNPQLLLQDLTREDIALFINEKLCMKPGEYLDNATKIFRDEIIAKAEGVFLWVDLVIKDLLRGKRNEDNLEELQKRLSKLPSGINDLYRHMLERENIELDLYQAEATRYFHLILVNGPLTLLRFSIAADEELLGSFLAPGASWNLNKIYNINLDRVAVRIRSRCAGLLEVQEHNEDQADEMAHRGFSPHYPEPERDQMSSDDLALLEKLTSKTANMTVQFVHRTAHEFLTRSEERVSIVPKPSNDCCCMSSNGLRAGLALLISWHAVGISRLDRLGCFMQSILKPNKDSGITALAITILRRIAKKYSLPTSDRWLGNLANYNLYESIPGDGKDGINFLFWFASEGFIDPVLEFFDQKHKDPSYSPTLYTQLLQASVIHGKLSVDVLKWFISRGADLSVTFPFCYSPRKSLSLRDIALASIPSKQWTETFVGYLREMGLDDPVVVEPPLRDLLLPYRAYGQIFFYHCQYDLGYTFSSLGRGLDMARNFQLYLLFDQTELTWYAVNGHYSTLYSKFWNRRQPDILLSGLAFHSSAHSSDKYDAQAIRDGIEFEAYVQGIKDECRQLYSAKDIANTLQWPDLEQEELRELDRWLFRDVEDEMEYEARLMATDDLIDRISLRLRGSKFEEAIMINEFVDWFVTTHAPDLASQL